MNILGHASVALASGGDDPVYVLGAVLPDLASMVGVRVDRSQLEGRLGDGVRCHVMADSHFHGDPAFRAGAAALRRDLTARGLERGPARAVAHAGWELLLDGTLLGSDAEAAYWRSLEHTDGALHAVRARDRDRWLALVPSRTRRPRPALRYDDPAWVAERLHALLAHRPRLGFRRDQIVAVSEVLGGHRQHVAGVGPKVLATTAGSVARHITAR
jgi:hypothetical protein